MAEITVREALHDALQEEMERDHKVCILGEDISDDAYGGTYSITSGLSKKFGLDRVMDTPIAEAGIVGMAVGGAMGGLRPIAELMTVNFSLLALDQIVNHAAKIYSMFGGQIKIPLVVRTPNGFGSLSATHSQNFDAYFAYVPGLKVVAPGTPYDAKGLLKNAIRDDDPVIFLEHTAVYRERGEVPEGEFLVPFGEAEVKREGSDVTIVAWSRMLTEAHKAADALASEGISAEIVDLRTLRPLDTATIVRSVEKTTRAVVAGEDWRSCGMTAEIAATIAEGAFDFLDAPVRRVAMAEVPMPYAFNLEAAIVPTAAHIVEAVREVLR